MIGLRDATLGVALSIGLSPLATPPAAAWQTPPPPTFEAQVDVVSITAVVFDKAGRFVEGLGKDDVEVYENGVLQDLLYFREVSGSGEKIPLSVVLTLDSSGSMKQSLPFLQEAAISFVDKLEEGDQALVVDFSTGVRSSAEFTDDHTRLEEFVDALQAWGSTALNDAVHYSLNRVRDRPGRKAVVVFSDGADQNSEFGQDEVIDYARVVEATVYGVGFKGHNPGGFLGGSPKGFLKRVASETGGQFFSPSKVGELREVFAAISEELHRHYALAFTPKRPGDGTWRELEVRPRRKDIEIRVRKGYLALRRNP